MSKILRNRKILLCGFIPNLSTNEIDFNKYKEARGLFIQDPWERVKSIFSKDDLGRYHPELINALLSAQWGGLTGILFGGFIEAKKATENFMRTSDTTIFYNKREAYKTLNNENWKATLKGSFKWGPTFALFLGSFSFISSCCELYRNKIDILDNVIAGATVGALNRFMFGIRGMLVGGVLGSLFGTFYGFTFWAVAKLGKKDYLEIKYAQFAFAQYKAEKKMLAKGSDNNENKKIVESGLHVMHLDNPLDLLKDEENHDNINETNKK